MFREMRRAPALGATAVLAIIVLVAACDFLPPPSTASPAPGETSPASAAPSVDPSGATATPTNPLAGPSDRPSKPSPTLEIPPAP